MAIVTGVLADFGRAALSSSSVDRHPVIEFRASGNAVKASGSVLYATRPITTTPEVSTGKWSVDLEQTDVLSPHIWYEMSIRWLDSDNNFIARDELPWRLYVPGAGGAFSDLVRVSASPLQVFISPGAVVPLEAEPGDFLFDPYTNELYQVA